MCVGDSSESERKYNNLSTIKFYYICIKNAIKGITFFLKFFLKLFFLIIFYLFSTKKIQNREELN